MFLLYILYEKSVSRACFINCSWLYVSQFFFTTCTNLKCSSSKYKIKDVCYLRIKLKNLKNDYEVQCVTFDEISLFSGTV